MTDTDRALDADSQTRVFQAAYDLYCRQPDWVTFFREILGKEGIIRRSFRDRESRAVFEKTETYAEIQQMLTRLRERSQPPRVQEERTRVITVRLPRSLHDTLRAEAHEHNTSMNQLCISKLLQFIDEARVPNEI